LIPRADTESLVEFAIERVTSEHAKVLDLGTGTGAIALAIASEYDCWDIHACDFNSAAVELANRNARQLADRQGAITIVQSDWFGAYDSDHFKSFDLIVSNPPYIDANDEHLEQGDLRFEPDSALVADNKGYADIFHIIEQAGKFLKPGGWLMIEHGFEQGAMVRQHFAKYGYADVQTKKDLGDNDRFTVGMNVGLPAPQFNRNLRSIHKR
jgi:release factor glutamine methyltransferase